jgi:hypothetical protein
VIEWIAAIILIVTGVAHSCLGEASVIRPLIANRDWQVAGIPRWAADPLLRFAWHLTTIAWWALAAVLVGVPIEIAFAVNCLLAAGLILVVLPGHLAWPLFLTAGLLALWAGDALPKSALWVAVVFAALAAVVAGAFHVAWAAGSRRGAANVIPQDPGASTTKFLPRPIVTLAVALALFSFAAFVVMEAAGTGPSIVRWAVITALVILTLRVFGEGKYVGVLKQVRGTGFARADDKYWTPTTGLLALGALASLVLGQL